EISPSVSRIRLQTALISVVLPAPFGPSRPKKLPAGTSRARASRARGGAAGGGRGSSFLLIGTASHRPGGEMIERIDDAPAGVIGIRASGKLTKDDYESVLEPALKGA